MTRMRAIIAQRMVESVRISPHAYTVYKVDMTRIARLREREKAAFEQRNGVKLTYMPFIAAAAVEALQQVPHRSMHRFEGMPSTTTRNIHLGIAVALEWGLIVPVVKQAETRSFVRLARAIADLADRARTKKLKPEEARDRLSPSPTPASSARIRHAHHQSARVGDSRHRRAQERAGGPHRRRGQRHHRHPLDAALLPRLRSPHHRRRRLRQVHGRVQKDAGELEPRDR